MSDAFRDSVFYWTFSSGTGDAYYGYTVTDTAALVGVPVGSVFASPHGFGFGRYTVTGIVDYGVDLSDAYGIGHYAEGATAVYAYFDAFSGRLLPTYYGSQGIPTSYAGLGGEFDYVLSPSFGGYDDFGYGGLYLIA
ncbi:MAG: hypothetical protein ICV73_08500 [Acetobacteraceae bacterium]|nr:hypothetical protein [Acetobacteraceae bacterium]